YKENVRAEMRRQLKRTLRKYGYPPENKDEAIDFILKQAEMVADELSKA
ncbi:type I restriction enzyme endonuclease domain-containing protein, partial [Avibacterium avium]